MKDDIMYFFKNTLPLILIFASPLIFRAYAVNIHSNDVKKAPKIHKEIIKEKYCTTIYRTSYPQFVVITDKSVININEDNAKRFNVGDTIYCTENYEVCSKHK